VTRVMVVVVVIVVVLLIELVIERNLSAAIRSLTHNGHDRRTRATGDTSIDLIVRTVKTMRVQVTTLFLY